MYFKWKRAESGRFCGLFGTTVNVDLPLFLKDTFTAELQKVSINYAFKIKFLSVPKQRDFFKASKVNITLANL